MEKVYTTPLSQKLGLKPGTTWLLWREAEGFRSLLDPLPDGVAFTTELGEEVVGAVVFLADRAALADFQREMKDTFPSTIWFAWPKKTSPKASDIEFDPVQAFGLSLGLVDNKVCAIDADWSGLRFVPRKRT